MRSSRNFRAEPRRGGTGRDDKEDEEDELKFRCKNENENENQSCSKLYTEHIALQL